MLIEEIMYLKKKLRKDLPPIDISHKAERGLFGRVKSVPRTKREQRKLKAILTQQYPDRYFVDDLKEYNSIKSRDQLSWIDDLEAFDMLME